MAGLPTALPDPRIPEPSSAPPLRWGILAPGRIARAFVAAAHAHTSSRVVAVGSRSAERATSFAIEYGLNRGYGSYAELVADPDVQAVYVASPHSEHRDQALLAIEAGKPVLVEKAFTETAAQAREVVDAAAAARVAVMEAMWSRFLPHYDVVRQLLVDGSLGDVSTVAADHGQYLDAVPDDDRLLNPQLAGGALLDLGIYPVSFAVFALGLPTSIHAIGQRARTGVDGQVSALFTAANGAHALINTTLFAKTPTTASIDGSLARLEIPGDFYMPQPITLIDRDGNRRVWDANPLRRHEGFAFEIAEFARVVTEGRAQSDLLPAAETVAIMGVLDDIRSHIDGS